MKAERNYTIPSVGRAIDVLELLSNSGKGLNLANICESLSIPKSTAFGILRTLENRGLIQKDEYTRQYRIGLKSFEIGSSYANSLDLRQAALPYLEDLSHRTGETCHLAILDNWEVVYIEKIETSHMVRLASRLGGRLPAYSTALGKVLLAARSDQDIERFIAEVTIVKHASNTIDTPERLKLALEQARADGYAIDDEEQTDYVRCLAAPVLNRKGQAVAAISVSGPVNRVTRERQPELIEIVKKIAAEISVSLGWCKRQSTGNSP